MTTFLRLLAEPDKAAALAEAAARYRRGEADARCFELAPEAFDAVPGKPFAYWVSDGVRETFRRLSVFESGGRAVRVGLQTSDDFRFVRCWWESGSTGVPPASDQDGRAPGWSPFAKNLAENNFPTFRNCSCADSSARG